MSGDIVDRLRSWVYTQSLYATAIEAAEEIERLRGDAEIARLRLEAAHKESDMLAKGLTLTDEERMAIEVAADLIDAKTCGDPATLRKLLERTK